MRILCLGDIQLASPLRAMGHEVKVLGGPDLEVKQHEDSRIFFGKPQEAKTLLREAIAKHKPEALLMGDDSSPMIHLGHEEVELPRLWWSIDTHLHGAWHVHLARSFHRVFGAQKPHLHRLRDAKGREAAWLPLFFPEALAFTPWSERNTPVTFVGTLDAGKNPKRVAFFEALGKRLPLQISKGHYRKFYTHSKVVINQAVAGDLNNRVVEAMGCGAALVTEALPQGFSGIAKPGSDFLTYAPGDVEAAAKAIQSLLDDDPACEAMARAGHEQVHTRHLGKHRAADIDAVLRTGSANGDWEPGPATPEALDRLAYVHGVLSRLGYPEDLRRFFGSESKRRAEALLKRDDHAYPWSRLALAEMAVQSGDWKSAGPRLRDFEPVEEPEYMEAFSPIRAVMAAQTGDGVEALYWVRRGLRITPDNGVLLQMQEKLKLG